MDETMPDARADGPGKTVRVMIWQYGKPTQVEMRWGLPPFEPDGLVLNLLRAEGREVQNRCLIIANELYLRPGTLPNKKRRKVELITEAPFFCFAGTWSPERPDWPASFAGLTVEAYPDIEPHQDRHMAVVHEEDWIDWLRAVRPVEEMLRPFPLGSFSVSGPPVHAEPAIGDLFD